MGRKFTTHTEIQAIRKLLSFTHFLKFVSTEVLSVLAFRRVVLQFEIGAGIR